jgi:hypothetical protein
MGVKLTTVSRVKLTHVLFTHKGSNYAKKFGQLGETLRLIFRNSILPKTIGGILENS